MIFHTSIALHPNAIDRARPKGTTRQFQKGPIRSARGRKGPLPFIDVFCRRRGPRTGKYCILTDNEVWVAVLQLSNSTSRGTFGALASRFLSPVRRLTFAQVYGFARLCRCVTPWSVARPRSLELTAEIAACALIPLPSLLRPDRFRPDVKRPKQLCQFWPGEPVRWAIIVLSPPFGPEAVFERNEHFN